MGKLYLYCGVAIRQWSLAIAATDTTVQLQGADVDDYSCI